MKQNRNREFYLDKSVKPGENKNNRGEGVYICILKTTDAPFGLAVEASVKSIFTSKIRRFYHDGDVWRDLVSHRPVTVGLRADLDAALRRYQVGEMAVSVY